jgi:hypothetical protein
MTWSKNITAMAAVLVLGTVPALAAGLLDLPPGAVAVTHGTWNQGAYSTIDVTLSLVPTGPPPGYHVANGTYSGWCLEDNYQDDAPPGSMLTLLDSTETDPLSCDPGGLAGIPWDWVNYLLNHPQGTLGNIPSTIEDVQAALWIVAGTHQPINPTFPTTQAVTDLVNDTTTNGTGFTPSGDEVVAVILCADGLGPSGYQDTIIEVSLMIQDPVDIFADGFEDGNTDNWSSTTP